MRLAEYPAAEDHWVIVDRNLFAQKLANRRLLTISRRQECESRTHTQPIQPLVTARKCYTPLAPTMLDSNAGTGNVRHESPRLFPFRDCELQGLLVTEIAF